VRSLPGSFETASAVMGAMSDIVMYGRPDDYIQTLKQQIDAVRQPAAEKALREVMNPKALTWVIVGDFRQIEKPVRALNLGEVEVIDADGNVKK
jgi:predicted Zn-dependent peptidase